MAAGLGSSSFLSVSVAIFRVVRHFRFLSFGVFTLVGLSSLGCTVSGYLGWAREFSYFDAGPSFLGLAVEHAALLSLPRAADDGSGFPFRVAVE